jgi:hypothetical protein
MSTVKEELTRLIQEQPRMIRGPLRAKGKRKEEKCRTRLENRK